MKSDMGKWETKDGVVFLREIGLESGQAVLDFGCGVGHYTIPAAKVVGNEGIVYAVDKEQQVLDELQQKAVFLNLKNIRTIKTAGQIQIGLEDDSIDVVLLYDVLHYLKKEERAKLYIEAYRVLKQNGLLSVYPKHTLEGEPVLKFLDLTIEKIRQRIQNSHFVFEKRLCGFISHENGFNQDCILDFKKIKSFFGT
jgi:ubiquinone/menaquinone biosynthesis C-methylase UbiE